MIPHRMAARFLWASHLYGNSFVGDVPRDFLVDRITLQSTEILTAAGAQIGELIFQIGHPANGAWAGVLPYRPYRSSGSPSFQTIWKERFVNAGGQVAFRSEERDGYHSGLVIPQTNALYVGFIPGVPAVSIAGFDVEITGWLLTHSFMHNPRVFQYDSVHA